jgi:hypothetical protein
LNILLVARIQVLYLVKVLPDMGYKWVSSMCLGLACLPLIFLSLRYGALISEAGFTYSGYAAFNIFWFSYFASGPGMFNANVRDRTLLNSLIISAMPRFLALCLCPDVAPAIIYVIYCVHFVWCDFMGSCLKFDEIIPRFNDLDKLYDLSQDSKVRASQYALSAMSITHPMLILFNGNSNFPSFYFLGSVINIVLGLVLARALLSPVSCSKPIFKAYFCFGVCSSNINYL